MKRTTIASMEGREWREADGKEKRAGPVQKMGFQCTKELLGQSYVRRNGRYMLEIMSSSLDVLLQLMDTKVAKQDLSGNITRFVT